MTTRILAAGPNDLERVTDLLLAGAQAHSALDPVLWKLEASPREKIRNAVQASIDEGKDRWLLAQVGDDTVGLTHAMRVPVPPIYHGKFGEPGLLMEDSFVLPEAPSSVRSDLLLAAEDDLLKTGARMIIVTSVAGGAWEEEYARSGYNPITHYFSRTGLRCGIEFPNLRRAVESDIAGIVAASAVHRRKLEHLNPTFWHIHAEADERFRGWMTYSLKLQDRDMFVSEANGQLSGYAISQPATRLHFPTPHDIASVGVIDDYFHEGIDDTDSQAPPSQECLALLEMAEVARQNRGNNAVLVVCPAAWRSKIRLLEAAGYHKAITWSFKLLE